MASISGQKTKTVAYFVASFKQWFNSSGKTQYQAAIELDTSQGAINNLLSGERSPSVGQMEKIATLLGQNLLDMLLGGRELVEGPKPPQPAPHMRLLYQKLNSLDGIALHTVEQVVNLAVLAQTNRLKQTVAGQQIQDTAIVSGADAECKHGFVYTEDIAEGNIIDPPQVTKVDQLVVDPDKLIRLNPNNTT